MKRENFVVVRVVEKTTVGSKENAVDGIFKALEIARTTGNPVTIKLAEGEYIISDTIELSEHDSFTSFEGENAVISSGIHI
ncbi:MAG: hypothetical protein IIW01_09475, partial [Thermoguttaceae bacterium]|nr:hypothetical protein [Thermoguttaceae bacterium]